MQPSLIYIDVLTGDLLERHVLAPSLHQLSIRHRRGRRRGVRLPIPRH
jgi:hypothetical protein